MNDPSIPHGKIMKEEDGKQEGVTKISLIPDAFYKSPLNEPYIYIYITTPKITVSFLKVVYSCNRSECSL
jgi:hypothetical protein